MSPLRVSQAMTAVKNRLNELTDLEYGAQNTFDVGAVFFLSKQYKNAIKDAVLCNGQGVSSATYPELFNLLGFANNGTISGTRLAAPIAGSNSFINPVDGSFYTWMTASGGSSLTLYIYNKSGTLLRSKTFSYGGDSIQKFVAYGNTIAIVLGVDRGNRYFQVSLDNGASWRASQIMPNGYSYSCPPIITDTAIHFLYSYQESSQNIDYSTYFNKAAGNFTAYTVFSGTNTSLHWEASTFGSGNVGFAKMDTRLYKVTGLNSWSIINNNIGTASANQSALLLNDGFYLATNDTEIKKFNKTTGAIIATYQNVPLSVGSNIGLIGVMQVSGKPILFVRNVAGKALLIDGNKTYIVNINPSVNPVWATAINDGSNQAILYTSERINFTDLLFNVPNINNIEGVNAWMRTKKHNGK